MPDNQFNPGPYGSASTSYSSASGPNPQSAPSAATTWASPGQNAGILPPTDQKSLISKPGLGLSVFWLVLGLITLAVGAGLASLNLTDATLPSLSSFSPGTSKSAQLEANRTYAFYAASTKLDSARKTSCVVSGPDGYSPTVTNANSSEELQLNRSYYKVATFSPNKSGSYSFACSHPANIDRADVFAIADITDTTTVTSSNDLIYARIFVGAGAFLGLVGLGLSIFGVIALVRKLKARRNFTDGLPAQGEDSASASSGAFSGYAPTTPGQAPLGFQAQGAAFQGPDAAAASQWAAAGAGAAGTAAAAAPQWGAPQGQWAAQAQSPQTQAFQAQSSPAAQSQASAQSSNSSAQAASAHSAPQAPNPYVTVQPQTNPYVTAQAQQAPASQPAQPQSYAQSAQPAQAPQAPQGYGQAQPGQNVQPGQPIEVYGQQATQPLNPYLTQPQAQAQAPQVPQGYGQTQASVAQSAAQAGTPAGTQVGTPAGAQAGSPAGAQGNAQAGSPAGAQGQNAAGYWPVPNFAPSDQAAQPSQPGQAGQPTQAPQGYRQVPQGYGQPVQPPANPYVTAQAQQAPASQTAQPQSYAQSAQPAQAPQVPQGYGQAQPGQNVQPGQPIEVYGQQATQPLNPYLTQPQPQPQPQTQPSVVPSAAQAPQGYGRPAQPGQGYGQVPQGYGQVPQGYGQAQPVKPAQSVQQPAQVPGVSQLEHPNQPGRPTQPLQPTNDTRVIASPTDTTQVVFEPTNPVSKSPASQSSVSQQAGANEEVEETDQRPMDAMYTDPTRVISTTEAANRYN